MPEGVNAIGAKNEWELVTIYVDSGATEAGISPEMLRSINTVEGHLAKMGVMYEVANGLRIPNLGEKKFRGESEEWMVREMTAQVCDVNKALLSVSKLVKTDHKVVFDTEGSYIEDKWSGERMWLTDEGGMYALKLWVKGF